MSTFSGLNTALSALRYQQVALDVANNNVANVNTVGYTRRRAESGAIAAPDQPAMWSRYVGHGDGVGVQQVARLADPLLDARSRRENATLSYLTAQQTVLNRVETGINEPGDNGLSAALQELRSAFHDLVSDPAGAAARETVLAKAGAVASAFKAQSDNLTTEITDQHKHVQTAVLQINDAATDLARLNKTIAAAQVNNTDVGTLQDDRDRLALTLAKLTGAAVDVQPDGQYNLTVNGVSLVAGGTATTMVATPTASAGVTVTLGGADVTAGLNGELGGVADVLNTTLPAYKSGLDALATTFVQQMNDAHAQGQDLNGVQGGPLFAFDPAAAGADPAAHIVLAVTDRNQIAAAAYTGTGVPTKDGTNADRLSTAFKDEGSYTALVTRFGTSVASVNRQTTTQITLTNQVDDEREQLAGVSLDEETVNMVAAQHAYEAASKMMTVLDSILNTLINNTGVTR